MSYIKSPLNYVGGKYKLLPQILPLFPNNIDTFVDVFTGGGNVSVNVSANRKICNDLESHVIDFYNNIKLIEGCHAKQKILDIVDKYQLSKTNVDGFSRCREAYNNNQTWDMFYATVTHAFNYQIRYNGNGKYNMPFGKDRSYFNPSLQAKFVEFVNAIDDTYYFTNKDFREIDIDKLKSNDFVYLDPPYLVTVASYNENGGWTEQEEHDLLILLDRLTEQGIKWALSNVLTHKGKSNDILIKWCEDNKDRYIVHHLNHTYSNCNYHDKTGTSGVSDEVLICNYHKCGDCIEFDSCTADSNEREHVL